VPTPLDTTELVTHSNTPHYNVTHPATNFATHTTTRSAEPRRHARLDITPWENAKTCLMAVPISHEMLIDGQAKRVVIGTTHRHTHTHTHTHTHIHIHTHTHTHTHIHTTAHVQVCVCVCEREFTCLCVQISVYIHRTRFYCTIF